MKQAVRYGAFDFIDKPNLDGLEEIASRGLKMGLNSNEKTNDDSTNFLSEYKQLLE